MMSVGLLIEILPELCDWRVDGNTADHSLRRSLDHRGSPDKSKRRGRRRNRNDASFFFSTTLLLKVDRLKHHFHLLRSNRLFVFFSIVKQHIKYLTATYRTSKTFSMISAAHCFEIFIAWLDRKLAACTFYLKHATIIWETSSIIWEENERFNGKDKPSRQYGWPSSTWNDPDPIGFLHAAQRKHWGCQFFSKAWTHS